MRNKMITKNYYKDKSIEQIKNDDKLEEIKKKIEKTISLEKIKRENQEAATKKEEADNQKSLEERTQEQEEMQEELNRIERELKEIAQNQVK